MQTSTALHSTFIYVRFEAALHVCLISLGVFKPSFLIRADQPLTSDLCTVLLATDFCFLQAQPGQL